MRVVAGAAVAVGLAYLPATVTASARDRCGGSLRQVERQNRFVRIYVKRDSIYACARATGKSKRLGPVTQLNGMGPNVIVSGLAGTFVAYSFHHEGPGSTYRPNDPIRLNVKTWKTTDYLNQGGCRGARSYSYPLVDRFGSVAWICFFSASVAHAVINAADGRGVHVVGTADSNANWEFRIHASNVRWAFAEQRGSYRLIPAHRHRTS